MPRVRVRADRRDRVGEVDLRRGQQRRGGARLEHRVVEHEGLEAARDEGERDRLRLAVGAELVAAAGADHDGRAAALCLVLQVVLDVGGERGNLGPVAGRGQLDFLYAHDASSLVVEVSTIIREACGSYEYLVDDGVHLTEAGMTAFSQLIRQALCGR